MHLNPQSLGDGVHSLDDLERQVVVHSLARRPASRDPNVTFAEKPTVFTNLRLPANRTGPIDVVVMWDTSATSGNVEWCLQAARVEDGENNDPALNSAQCLTDAAAGSTNYRSQLAFTNITTTDCAAGEVLYVKITRDGTDVDDTFGAVATLREGDGVHDSQIAVMRRGGRV